MIAITLIEDVNNKVGKHENIRAWCEKHGILIRRQRLNVGDYALPPKVVVDTKYGMGEIYSDIVSDHDRFRAECIRAQEDGIRLVILIEDEDITSLEEASKWRNPRRIKWERDNAFIVRAQEKGKMLNHHVPKPPVDSDRLVGMMNAMSMKYGVEWAFCHPRDTGEEVYRILTGGEPQLPKS